MNALTLRYSPIGSVLLSRRSASRLATGKRIAAPMVRGLVTSFALEPLVYPALFAFWKGRGLVQQSTIHQR